MIEVLQKITDSFGAIFLFPCMLFIIELFFKVDKKKAFISAISAGAGLQGFYFMTGAYSDVISPIIESMVENTGVNLPALDVGWQETASVAYSTQVGMAFMPVAIALGLILFFTKFTDIFQPSDLWNDYLFMIFGSMLYILTNNFWLSMGMMIFMFCLNLTMAELTEKRWSNYFKYPGCSNAGFLAPNAWILVGINWLLNKLGLYKIKADPKSLNKKLSVFGDPLILGFMVGALIGILGNVHALNSLDGWGSVTTCAISTAALMVIFPKIGSIFASSFAPLTDASKKYLKGRKGDFYINLNDACSYGDTANLVSALISIPLIVLLAFILPGNIVLPLVSLPSTPYESPYGAALSNGNIVMTTVSTLIFAIIRLLVASACASLFTQVALSTGFEMASGVVMISSMGTDLGNPVLYLIFLAFLSRNPVIIAIVIVAYLIYFVWFKKNKARLQDWIEDQALNPGKKSE